MADFVQRGGLAGSRVEDDLEFHWQLVDGLGTLADVRSQAVAYFAPEEPGLTRVRVTVRQRDLICVNEALITVTNELLAQINAATAPARGLPGTPLSARRANPGGRNSTPDAISSWSTTATGTSSMPPAPSL